MRKINADGSLKGKDCYYLYDEVISAAKKNGGGFIAIKQK